MKKQSKETVNRPIQIRWNVPPYIKTQFASHMVVQKLENEYKLLFFEMKPPIRISSEESVPQEIPADCIASIIISDKKFPSFIKAMQLQIDKQEES